MLQELKIKNFKFPSMIAAKRFQREKLANICYRGTPISPVGHAGYCQGGIGDIAKGLGRYCQGAWEISTCPTEPVPSTHGARGFDL